MAQPNDWTPVPKRKGKRNRPLSNTPLPLPSPSSSLTIPEIEREYHHHLTSWLRSACRRETLTLLSRLRPDPGWGLGTAICLASGTFAGDNFTNRRRSLVQLAVFLDLVAQLQLDAAAAPIRVLAQEPLYTPVDREFLAGRGVEVLANPEIPAEESGGVGRGAASGSGLGEAGGFLGRGTMLFEPFMGMTGAQVRAVVRADPVLYVGTKIVPTRVVRAGKGEEKRKEEVGEEGGEDEGELVRRFVDARWCYRFPHFEPFPNALEGMFICGGRKDDEEV